MCQLCEADMKNTRLLLAAKVIGLLPKEDDTELDDTIGYCVRNYTLMVFKISETKGQEIMDCPNIRPKLATGIRKVLPTMTIEERFELALASGAIRL